MEKRPWLEHYDDGVPASIDYTGETIVDQFARIAKRYPGNVALIFKNKKISYAELDEDVERCGRAMAQLGVQKGTRVAIQLPTLPQAVIAYHAALRIGAEVVMTNPLYTPREIEHQWNDAGCELAVVADFLWDQKLRAVRDRLPVRNYLIASIPEYLGFPLNLLAPLKLKREDPALWAKVEEGDGVHRFKKLVRSTEPGAPRPAISVDDIALLQYTGGTTGVSKGAVLTHGNLAANIQQLHAWFTDLRMGEEVVMACLPLFHVFGMTVAMNFALSAGAAAVLVPNPRDIPDLVGNAVKHRVTLFPAVPALFNAMNNHPGIDRLDLSSIRSCFSGSAPIPIDVLERFEKLTGARIVEGFGMSETSPVASCNPLGGVRKIGSVGIPMPDTVMKVVDVDDPSVEMPVGQEGELLIQGPQVTPGYWNRPDETAQTIRNGWLHSGDLATMDDDGYFRIVGRKKDMIAVGGMKVFPDEVDNELMAHPAILEAATIGIPDEQKGERVKSFLVLQPGQSLTAEEVDAWCRERLAPYKVPKDIEFLDELPKSTVMKVLRRELRDRELAKRGDQG
jgi:long-chain acyl-CoA synthetase